MGQTCRRRPRNYYGLVKNARGDENGWSGQPPGSETRRYDNVGRVWFYGNHPCGLVVTAHGLGWSVERWRAMTVLDSSASVGMTRWPASGGVGDDELETESVGGTAVGQGCFLRMTVGIGSRRYTAGDYTSGGVS